MALSTWKEWKNAQKKRDKESDIKEPLVISAQQTSRKEMQSEMQYMPKGTSQPVSLLKSNSHPVKHTQDLSCKGPTYSEKPTSIYKPHKNFHPYNPTMKHTFVSTEVGYKFTGNQYPVCSHHLINPDKNDKEEDKNNKEDNTRTGSPNASTSSDATK